MPKPLQPEFGPWFTPAQAATYLQCSTRSLYRLIEQGVLPTHKIGQRMVRLHRDDLDAAMQKVTA